MRCTNVQKLLPAMAAGELPDNKAAALEEHLQRCSSCATDYRIYQESIAALRRSRDRAVPDGLWNGFWEKIRDEAVLPQAGGVRHAHLSWRGVFSIAVAAAAMAVVFVGLAIIHRGQSSSIEQRQQPLIVKGIIKPPDSSVLAKKDIPRMYVLCDMARQDLRPSLMQPLPDFSRGHNLDRCYTLKQVKLPEKDESKYEF